MNATVSLLLPSASQAAPRPASRAATAADAGGDADGTGAPLDAGTTGGAARPFSTWMREQQQQQQLQERRRLAGTGAPGSAATGAAAGRTAGRAPGVAADTEDASSAKPADAGSAQGVAVGLPDPIVREAPQGGLAALLGVPPPPVADAGTARTDEALADGAARDRFGGPPAPAGVPGSDADRLAGRGDATVGDALRRAAGGPELAAGAPRAAADGSRAETPASSDAARRPTDALGERPAGDVGRPGAPRGTPVGTRLDSTHFATSLDAARLADGRREAPVAPPQAATPGSPSAADASVAFGSHLPAEPLRADAASGGVPVLELAATVDGADFAPGLGAQVAVLAREGVQRAELNLHPADMGPVSIDISIVGTTAHVDFGADVAATRSAIEAGLADLAAALHEAGFTLAGGGVSARARERDGGEAGREASDGARRVAAGRGGQGADADESVGSSRVTRRTVQLRQGAVDLYA